MVAWSLPGFMLRDRTRSQAGDLASWGLTNKALRRYAQSRMRSPDQGQSQSQSQRPFPVEYRVDPVALADPGLEVLRRWYLLIHAELDGLHAVRPAQGPTPSGPPRLTRRAADAGPVLLAGCATPGPVAAHSGRRIRPNFRVLRSTLRGCGIPEPVPVPDNAVSGPCRTLNGDPPCSSLFAAWPPC